MLQFDQEMSEVAKGGRSSPDLEAALMAGLARDLAKRPATIKAFCARFCGAARAEPEKKKGFLSGLFGKD